MKALALAATIAASLAGTAPAVAQMIVFFPPAPPAPSRLNQWTLTPGLPPGVAWVSRNIEIVSSRRPMLSEVRETRDPAMVVNPRP